MSALFTPFRVGALELRNRIVIAPMCQYSAVDGCMTDWHVIHLGHLALSGAALLTIEATAVLPEARITYADVGLWNDATEAAIARTLESIRRWSDILAQMVMAGLWAKWKSPTSGEEVLSCTILTCGPNNAMGELHDRMPVILAEIDWPKWLGEEPASEQDLLSLLRPCQDEALKIWAVDKMVGNVRNNGPQLILPVLSNEVPA
jgi:hypothetical protein